MSVTVEWFGQLRDAAQVGEEDLETEPAASVADVLRAIANARGAPLSGLLLRGGDIARTLFVSLDDEQVTDLDGTTVADGARLVVMTPISGG